MTYAKITTEKNNTAYLKYSDGGMTGQRTLVLDPEKWSDFCTEHAKDALKDGNYYTGIGVGVWNKLRRKYVHDQWIKLKDMILDQLSTAGEININEINFFTENEKEREHTNKLVELVKTLKKQDLQDIIELIDIVDC